MAIILKCANVVEQLDKIALEIGIMEVNLKLADYGMESEKLRRIFLELLDISNGLG